MSLFLSSQKSSIQCIHALHVIMPISHVHVHANNQPLDRREEPIFYSFPPYTFVAMAPDANTWTKRKRRRKMLFNVLNFRKKVAWFRIRLLGPPREFHSTIIGSKGNFLLQRVQAVRGSRLGTGLRFRQLWPCLPLSNHQWTRCTGVRASRQAKGLALPAFPLRSSLPAGISSVRFTHWSSRRQV